MIRGIADHSPGSRFDNFVMRCGAAAAIAFLSYAHIEFLSVFHVITPFSSFLFRLDVLEIS